MVISSSKSVVETVLSELQKSFEVKVSEANHFVGIEIKRSADGSIFISQEVYIKQIIKRFGFEDANPISVPADPQTNVTGTSSVYLEDGEVPYRQLVGSLMFAAIVTRPDIAYSVGVVSRYLNKHTREHWNAVKRIVKYLAGTSNYEIKYDRQYSSLPLIGYADSDFASDLQTRRSTCGYVFKMCNAPVTWSSKRQSNVVLSTTEAEYVAASHASKEATWLQRLLTDLKECVVKPVVLNIDNQSAIRLIRNPEFHNRTKHIDIKYHFVREKFEDGEILPTYVNTSQQVADILTKPLPRVTFEKLRDLLGVIGEEMEK